MGYLLAVDGGGTKTEFALMVPSGTVIRRLALGPSNYQNVGIETARNVLQEGLSQVTADVSDGQLLGACLGLAGLDTPHDERVYKDMVGQLFGAEADKVRIENDCFIALHSGTLGAAGIAIIAGTGSMAIGMNEAGERARSGGWGYRFGDEGSGYYIGYQALVRAVRARDGRAPETVLAERIEQQLNMPLFEVVTRYTAEDPGPDAIGALAPLVTEAAREGDQVASEILADAAAELVLAAQAIASQLTFERRPVPVVLAGGAFRSDLLREGVEVSLRRELGDVECLRPTLPPVAGACILALDAAGITLSAGMKANLTESLK